MPALICASLAQATRDARVPLTQRRRLIMEKATWILVHEGVMMKLTIIDVLQAVVIAQANGLMYAERFVNKYGGKVLKLDENLKVVSEKAPSNDD